MEDSEEDFYEKIAMFNYFWQKKEDPESWSGYTDFEKELKINKPKLLKAWKKFKKAKKKMNNLCK